MDSLKEVIGEMAQSTRLIAKTQLKAAEKETNENTTLKSFDTADLIDFCPVSTRNLASRRIVKSL